MHFKSMFCVYIVKGVSLNVTYQGFNYLYGYDVIPRPTSSQTSFLRTFIDVDRPLSSGLLQHFYFYAPVTNVSLATRLQIWRPVSGTSYNFTLIWENRVIVNPTITGALYTVNRKHDLTDMASVANSC